MVVTRFAPSPTGMLHLGGARTALFNWLFAKKHNGKMLLRIEDTDRVRSTDEATKQVIDALKWLKIDWNGEPILQHMRLQRHAEIAHQMLETGAAYKCYATPAQLEADRLEAQEQGNAYHYDGRWRDGGKAFGLSTPPEGTPYAIRIASPRTGTTKIVDVVQGAVEVNNDQLDDFIILRSDGTPTYMLGVVVDDYDSGVTHVIRGDDHLTNALRQSIVYDALGWQCPIFAHIPLIHGSDGAKLSKRHGAVSVQEWRDKGYLPQAVLNALVRLGWSHGDQEFFTINEMIEAFSLENIGKGAARFDEARLSHLNKHHIKLAKIDDLIDLITPYVPQIKECSEQQLAAVKKLLPQLQQRATTIFDIAEGAKFLFLSRPIVIAESGQKFIAEPYIASLRNLVPLLNNLSSWTEDELSSVIKTYASDNSLKLGNIAQPLRVILTGSTSSPGIFDVLEALGKRESLSRITDVVTNS